LAGQDQALNMGNTI